MEIPSALFDRMIALKLSEARNNKNSLLFPIMSDFIQSSRDDSESDLQIRCVKCDKLLAKKIGTAYGFEIKCPRCGTLNRVLEQLSQQVVIIDPVGKIIYINKAIEDVTGYHLHEAVGKSPSELWGGQMPAEFYQDMWKTISQDKKMAHLQLTNKKKNGELYDLKLSISPVLDTSGEVIFYFGIEDVI